jgi:hypothetical protein
VPPDIRFLPCIQKALGALALFLCEDYRYRLQVDSCKAQTTLVFFDHTVNATSIPWKSNFDAIASPRKCRHKTAGDSSQQNVFWRPETWFATELRWKGKIDKAGRRAPIRRNRDRSDATARWRDSCIASSCSSPFLPA